MWIVTTDLDGTLLNHEDYGWAGAAEAIDALEDRGIPLIFCTSKTRAEILPLRDAMENRHPFIVENGGAIYFPARAYRRYLPGALASNGYLKVALGRPYSELVAALEDAAREAHCKVRGFAGATAEEVAEWCGFSSEQGALAKQREYNEPFLLEEGDANALIAAIEKRGLQWTRGSRFWHILGTQGKGAAIEKLREVYESVAKRVQIAALGDSLNDLPMLERAEYPILIPSPQLPAMRVALPHAQVAPESGSKGWGLAVLAAIPEWLRFNAEIPRPPFEY